LEFLTAKSIKFRFRRGPETARLPIGRLAAAPESSQHGGRVYGGRNLSGFLIERTCAESG